MVELRDRAGGHRGRGLRSHRRPPGEPRSCSSGTEAAPRRARGASGICTHIRGIRPRICITTQETHDMSHGWLHRLRSGGAARIPRGPAVRRPPPPPQLFVRPAACHPVRLGHRQRHPGGRGGARQPERGVRLGRRARQAQRGVHQVGQDGAAADRPQIQVPPGFEQFFPRMPGPRARSSRRARARASSSPRTATSSPTITSWTAPTR